MSLILHLSLEEIVPQPITNFCKVWGKSKRTLRAWCEQGLIPGAFKQPSGPQSYEWWVDPKQLLKITPEELESLSHPHEQAQEKEGRGNSRPDRKRALRPKADRWNDRLRSPKAERSTG